MQKRIPTMIHPFDIRPILVLARQISKEKHVIYSIEWKPPPAKAKLHPPSRLHRSQHTLKIQYRQVQLQLQLWKWVSYGNPPWIDIRPKPCRIAEPPCLGVVSVAPFPGAPYVPIGP